ncbi:MAG: transposase [Sedimentisphaerales bacterium]
MWAYCLMPNHVHLIVVPESEDGLRRGIGEAHRRYSRRINFREGWRGHLWQGRFASFPMDERYLMLAVRYVDNIRGHHTYFFSYFLFTFTNFIVDKYSCPPSP